MYQIEIDIPDIVSEGKEKAMGFKHTKACQVVHRWAERRTPHLNDLINETEKSYVNFSIDCFFHLFQLQHDCHFVYFPDIIWSNCGCCSAFLRCSLTSPPTPLPVLCHTGITVSALASTPHLSKPSGKYFPPWFTYYIAEIQSQRHLVKISIVLLSEQWALLLMHCLYWAKRYAQSFPCKFTTHDPAQKNLQPEPLKRHKECISEKNKQALAHTNLASNTANITSTSVCPWEQEVVKNTTYPYILASQIRKSPCLGSL